MSIITNLLYGYNELRMYKSKSYGPWEFVITVFYYTDTLFIKSNSLPFYSNIWNPEVHVVHYRIIAPSTFVSIV